jgi:hypothetical protein
MTRRAVIRDWPLFLALENAARCCDLTPKDFLDAVAKGDLPLPVLISGQERWRLVDIEGIAAPTKRQKPWLKSV